MSFNHLVQVSPFPADEKAVPLLSGLPPSYQVIGEATSPSPADPPGPDEPDHSRPRRRCRRLGHFLVMALFVWFVGRYLLHHCMQRRFGSWDSDSDFDLPAHRHHPRPRETIDSCVESGNWSFVNPPEGHHPPQFEVWQRTELSLPGNTDDIFLHSRGVHGAGVLHVVEAADREDIGVVVTVGHNEDSDLFQRSSVCTLSRGGNGHGLGIFTMRPRHRPHTREELFFAITVSLPEGKGVTHVPRFETRLPSFGHIIHELPTHTFGSILLHPLNSPVYVKDLVGDKIAIHTKNSPIEGTFNISSSLGIKTSNAPVKVKINAFSQNNSRPTKVKVQTKNSVLVADLSLFSTFENKTGGTFSVKTRTSNSPLEVNFMHQSADSHLKLDAHTSNSPARVHLQPAFEGLFKLKTSIFPSIVTPDLDAEDPAGLGRKRVVNVKTIGHDAGFVQGDAAWVLEEDPTLLSSPPPPPPWRPHSAVGVEVSTKNSPLHLWL